MFFYASKILWMLIAPLNALCLLLLLGLIWRRWSSAGDFLATAAAVLIVILGILPIGPAMVTYLETQYHRPETVGKIDGIIVLGGAFDSYLSEKTGYGALTDNADRVIDFIRLAKRYPEAKLVFSGGSGHILQPERREADDAKAFFEDIGFDTKRITFEDRSRNTYENAAFSYDLLEPGPGERWVVITSAFHMPRTMGVFKEAGWHNVIPYPSDPKTDGVYRWWPQTLATTGNFHMLNIAVKEFVGTLAYYLSGKSALPFPRAIVNSMPEAAT